MAAKRKRRGLSGSPAEHKRGVKARIESASLYFLEASDLLEKKSCKKAFGAYIDGLRAEGEAYAHGDYAQGFKDTRLDDLRDQEGAVRRNFQKACLVGGGLSGIRRRKPRRTR